MKLKVFSVYDSKVSAYMKPFLMPATGMALRAWDSTVNQPDTDFHKYPGDFSLVELGEFDEETGMFQNYEIKKNLGTALEFRKNVVETSRPLAAVE